MKVIIKSQLKDVREKKGMSVRGLAKMAKMSKTYVSDVENNHKIPTIYSLCVLAATLGVRPEELYTYDIVP